MQFHCIGIAYSMAATDDDMIMIMQSQCIGIADAMVRADDGGNHAQAVLVHRHRIFQDGD